MPGILLLMRTQTYRAKAFVQAARRQGVALTVGSEHRSVFTKLTPGTSIGLDLDHPERAADQIAEFARDHPLAAILGVDESTTVVAALAAARLGLPHNSVESVTAARNKYRMRHLLAKAGLPSPAFRLAWTTDDPLRLAREVSYPCVLKPVALSASRGVIRANDRGQFLLAFLRVAAILREAGQPDVEPETARQILIEDYLPGQEVALEGILEDGRLYVLALFDKPDPLEGPFFEETIYVTPSRLHPGVQHSIVLCVEQATEALGLRTGPVHAELRVHERGPSIVEVAARSIGGLCSNTLRFGTGFSLEDLILRQALGEEFATFEREQASAGVMMIPIPRSGILRGIEGRQAASDVAGIEEVTITVPVGQRLIPLPEGSQYLGFIFARGDTPESVEAALREAHSRLDFTIEPDAEV